MVMVSSHTASADIDPLSGIDLVRIGAVGNAPYRADNPNAFVHNRGGVNYGYSIGRFEVTTAQWTEFFNVAFDRPSNDRIPHLIPPDFWGAAGNDADHARRTAVARATGQRNAAGRRHLVADGGDLLQLALQQQADQPRGIPQRGVRREHVRV